MYARLHLFTLGPGMREKAETSADQASRVLRGLKGFKGATFLRDLAVGEYGALSLWETKADADAANAAMQPTFQQFFGGIVTGSPTVRIFEVYEPKA